ncbi:MAG: hypothetical protein M1840_007699 [Geoglossum simile]|nr:MAG: hypothetical protein M1840_007699 [Geoglossum simile]
MASDQLSPALPSPGISPGSLEANPFGLQDLERHQRWRQQNPIIGSPAPLSFTSFLRPKDGEGTDYSSLAPTNSVDDIQQDKLASSHLLRSVDTSPPSRPISLSDSQYVFTRRPSDGRGSAGGIHWWTPISMIGMFILGLIGAVSHHVYYKSLDGQEVRDQLNKVRYGTALAVFTKTTMVGSVAIAYRQRIWWNFRKKAMSLSAIDSMFAVLGNPIMFYEKDMVINAKLATLMAVAVWLIPLVVVLSPASLLSNVATVTHSTVCPVASLNFSSESHKQFGKPMKRNGLNGAAMSYWNTTDANSTTPGWFDYWDQPSKNADRIAAMSRYLKRPVVPEDASLNSCGDSWNCTYSISFIGPGYKCIEIASGVDSDPTLIASKGAPFDISSLVPIGNSTYRAVVDVGEYSSPQVLSENGHPVQKPIPEELGVFKTEPVIWIGYTKNTTDRYPPSSPYAQWGNVMIPKIFACEHYETNYTVFFNYSGGQQIATVERKFLVPIINTSLAQSPNGTLDPPTFGPTSNFIYPKADAVRYKLAAVYHSLGYLIRSTLKGTAEWVWSQGGNTITHSDVTDTRLFDQHYVTPLPDLQDQIQPFYEDFLLSLLSDPTLIIAANVTVPCVKTRNANQFRYNASGLWPSYAIAIILSLASVFVGLISMHQNGVNSDMWFSRIMASTRNPTLDRLCVGACLGGGLLSKELSETRLRFGELQEKGYEGGTWDGRAAHCAFGTVEQTSPIVRGRVYAGLRLRRGEERRKKKTPRREKKDGSRLGSPDTHSEADNAIHSCSTTKPGPGRTHQKRFLEGPG